MGVEVFRYEGNNVTVAMVMLRAKIKTIESGGVAEPGLRHST